MNCIFCKNNSDSSKSVEHIVPESLGNDKFILPRGYVCDKCNNYFSRTFEQQLLDLPFFKQLRHSLNIKSKKGNIPNNKGFLIDPDLIEVEFKKDKNQQESISLSQEVEIGNGLMTFIPVFNSPGYQNLHMSKFLGKMAIEAIVYYALQYQNSVEEAVNQTCFDALKNYVKAGKKGQFWPYYERTLYDPEAGFQHPRTGEFYKVTSSFTFIVTESSQLLFQYLCLGKEFTIDLVNPDVEEFTQWLSKHDNYSPVLKQILDFNSS